MSECFSGTTIARFSTSIRSIKNEFAALSTKMETNRVDIGRLVDTMALLDKTSNRKGHRRGPKTLNKKTGREMILEIIQSRGAMKAHKVFQYATARGFTSKSTEPVTVIRSIIASLLKEGKLISPSYGTYSVPTVSRRRAA